MERWSGEGSGSRAEMSELHRGWREETPPCRLEGTESLWLRKVELDHLRKGTRSCTSW